MFKDERIHSHSAAWDSPRLWVFCGFLTAEREVKRRAANRPKLSALLLVALESHRGLVCSDKKKKAWKNGKRTRVWTKKGVPRRRRPLMLENLGFSSRAETIIIFRRQLWLTKHIVRRTNYWIQCHPMVFANIYGETSFNFAILFLPFLYTRVLSLFLALYFLICF